MATPTPGEWITFVRTRHVYDSYVDFFRFVEAAGFPTVYVDEIDFDRPNGTYIFTPMNGELPPHLERGRHGRKSRVVWWNLERPEDGTHAESIAKLDGLVDAIWVSDRYYATLHPRYRYVQLAGHRMLPGPAATPLVGHEKKWDLCTLAYLWGRREDAVKKLERQGLTIAPPAYGAEQQDEIIPCCRAMLNLHQYMELPTIAPIRFAIAASYRVPIISETFHDPEARSLLIAHATLHQLVDRGAIKALLSPGNHALLEAEGEKLHRALCVRTDFRNEVERAVDDVRRRPG